MLIDRKDCSFFHCLDLPGGETIAAPWDFRETEAEYHGGVSLAGRRVLEIGAASGCHSFWMERQGAQVVPYDLSPEFSWDLMPTPTQDREDVEAAMRVGIRRINAGWHYAAERLGSKLSLEHGTIYSVPESLGVFDVITFGSVLLHTRDPIGAVQGLAPRATEAILIMDRLPPHLDPEKPLMEFQPRIGMEKPFGAWTWWWFTPAVFIRLLTVLGYSEFDVKVSKHLHAASGKPLDLFTLVARR